MESIRSYAISRPVAVTSSADDATQEVNGTFLAGNSIIWLARGNVLDVFSATGRQNLATCAFHCPRGQEFQVLDVAELPQESAVLVALGTESGSGAVALFDYEASKIVTGWSLAHRVNKLSLVSAPLCSSQYPPQGLLHLLRGHHYVAAVGTEEGHVMLLAFNQRQRNAEGSHILNLQTVRYLSIDEVYAGQANQKFSSALVIPLNDAMYQSGKFKFETSSSNREVSSFSPEEVRVTGLRYITDSRTLCVGYNFGGAFQLYTLESLDLEFAHFAGMATIKTLEAVVDFTFLEPEDDPKNFCYIIVMAEKEGSDTSIACFYSLNYAGRRSLADGNSVYEGLQSITPRLELNLKNVIDYFVDRPVRFVSLQSLPSYSSKPLDESSRLYLGNGLCCFTLEEEGNRHLIIFDLNQWYLAQMPGHWTPGSGSSYVGLFSIPSATEEDSVLGTWIKPDSVTPFRHPGLFSQSEQFFQPTSLSFQLVLLTAQQVSTASFRGLQSSLLTDLETTGLQALLHPHNLYARAVKYGLIPTEGLNLAPTLNQMKETILSLALENGCAAFLTSCVASEGANMNLVEQWAWKQVDRLRMEREEMFRSLFGQSDFHTDRQVCVQLDHIAKQLGLLYSLYDTVDNVVRNLNIGVNEQLLDKKRTVYLLHLHLRIVIWFRHGGLLPEPDPSSLGPEEVALCFPRAELERFYEQRRRDITKLSSSVSPRDVLLIDNLVPGEVQETWTLEREEDIPYPPPSFSSLLAAYLRPEVDDVTKHRLVQYVFLDLAWLYSKNKEFENVLQHLVTFPSTYSLRPSLIKVTQAFWHLDHNNFDDALTVLMDPIVDVGDISNQQLRCVLRAFLYQDRAKCALKYITVRQLPSPELEDVRLRLTILLANNLITEALHFVRGSTNEASHRELMQHFLNGCRQLKKIHVLVTLPLTKLEEEDLARYCTESSEIELHEALLMFYLQRSRYSKAIALNEKMNKTWPPKEPALREKWERRNQLMQAFVSVLPPVMSKLTSLPDIRSISRDKKSRYPQPLSTSVRPTSSQTQYSASAFFRLAIDKTRSTWDEEMSRQTVSQTPFRQRKRKMETDDENQAPAADSTEKTPFLTDILEPRKVDEKKLAVFLTPRPNAETSQENNPSKRRRMSPSTPGRNGSILNPEIASFLAVTPYTRRNLSVAATPVTSRPPSILKSNRKIAEGYPEAVGQTPVPSDSVDASKLIRFQLPFITSPETAQQSDMSVEAEEFLSFEDEGEASLPKNVPAEEESAPTVCSPGVLPETEAGGQGNAEQDEVNAGKQFSEAELAVLSAVSTLPVADDTTRDEPIYKDATTSLAEVQPEESVLQQVSAAVVTRSFTAVVPDAKAAGDMVSEMPSFTEQQDAEVAATFVTNGAADITVAASASDIAEPVSPTFETLLPVEVQPARAAEPLEEDEGNATTVEEDIIKDALSSVGIIADSEAEFQVSYPADVEEEASEVDQEEAEAYSSAAESSDIVCLDVSSSSTRDDDNNAQESEYLSEEEEYEEEVHDAKDSQAAVTKHRYEEELTEEEDFPMAQDSSDELDEEEPDEVEENKRNENAAKGYRFVRKPIEFSDSSSSSASEETEPVVTRQTTETTTVRVTKTVSDDTGTRTESREEKSVRSHRLQLQLTDSEGSEDEQESIAGPEERDAGVSGEAEGLEQSVQSSDDSVAEAAEFSRDAAEEASEVSDTVTEAVTTEFSRTAVRESIASTATVDVTEVPDTVTESSHDAVKESTTSSATVEVSEVLDTVTESAKESITSSATVEVDEVVDAVTEVASEATVEPKVEGEALPEETERPREQPTPEIVAETEEEPTEIPASPQRETEESAGIAETTEETVEVPESGASHEEEEVDKMEEEDVQEEIITEGESAETVAEDEKPVSTGSVDEPEDMNVSGGSLTDDKDISEIDEGLKEQLLQVTLPELPCGPLVTSNVNNLSVILEEPESADLTNFMEDDSKTGHASEESLHESTDVQEAALLGSSQLQLSDSENKGDGSSDTEHEKAGDKSAELESPEQEAAARGTVSEDAAEVARETPVEEGEEVQPRVRRSSRSRRLRVPLPFRPDPGSFSSDVFRREGSVDSVSSEPAMTEAAGREKPKVKRTRRHSVADSPAAGDEGAKPLTWRRASSLRSSVDVEEPSSETPISVRRSRRLSEQDSAPSEAGGEPDEGESEPEETAVKPVERRQTRGRKRIVRLPFTSYSTVSNPDRQERRGSPSSVTSEPAETSFSTRTQRTRRHTVGDEPPASTEAAETSRRVTEGSGSKGRRDSTSLVIPSPLRRSARLAESKTTSRETSPESVASSTGTSRSRRSTTTNPRRVGRRPTLQPLFEALVSDDESENETTKSSSRKPTTAVDSSEDERNEAEMIDSEKATTTRRGKGRPRKVPAEQASSPQKEVPRTPKREGSVDASTSTGYNLRTPASKRKTEAAETETVSTKKSRTDDDSSDSTAPKKRTSVRTRSSGARRTMRID